MSKRGLWDEMGGLIEDDILKTFAVVAEPDALPGALRARCQGAVGRLLCMAPLGNDEAAWVKALR